MWKTGMEGGGRNGFHVYSNALFIYFFIFFFFNTINCRIWYTKLCKKNSWNNNSKIVWYHVNDRKQFTVIIHKASSSYLFFFFYSLFFIECWVYLKALIAEAILVGSSLYDEIRVNLICWIENMCVSNHIGRIFEWSRRGLFIGFWKYEKSWYRNVGKYERKMQNLSMKNNNGDTEERTVLQIIDDHCATLLLHDASLNKLETREVLGKYEFQTATIRMTVSLLPPHSRFRQLSTYSWCLRILKQAGFAWNGEAGELANLSTRSSQERLVLIKWLTCRSSFRLPELYD